MASLAPASGAVFSLLPPENATGNFTKVVQRVPVRIAVPADVLKTGKLRAGLSVIVDVDSRTAPTRDRTERASGEAVMSTASNDRRSARPGLPTRRWKCAGSIAFLAMVFGMFMAILDIQIVSASLAEIQAGLSASSDEISWVQTSYLIAEVIMIPLSGFLATAGVDAHAVHGLCRGFHRRQRAVRHGNEHRPDDRLPRHPGLHRRRHDPERLRRRLHDLPAIKRSIVSPMIGLVATLAPTIGPTVGGYLSNAFSWHWLFLVNVIPGMPWRSPHGT